MRRLMFPTHCVPPLLRNAIISIQNQTLAPTGLVVSSVFAGASLATQSGYDVLRPNNLLSPLAMYFLAIAASGERKTTVDKLALQAFYEFTECKPLLSENSPGDVEKPKKTTRFIYSDVTPFALISCLFENSRSAALLEDEAGRIFDSRLIEDLGLLNKLWTGFSISVYRKKIRITVESPRCTISWMIQPKTFRAVLKKMGNKLHDSGFLARCLICEPITTQGTRHIDENKNIDISGHKRYCNRVKELLESQVDFFVPGGRQLEQPRKVLSFDQYAQKSWIKTYNEIESNICAGGQFHDHPEYASKIAENIARLAGIFHVFEGKPGLLIAEETLNAATEVVSWYTQEYLRIFREPDFRDQIADDANFLEKALARYAQDKSLTWVRISWLRQYGPNSLRKANRLEPAIEYLFSEGRISLSQDKKYTDAKIISKTAHIALNTLLPMNPIQQSTVLGSQSWVQQAIYNSSNTFCSKFEQH